MTRLEIWGTGNWKQGNWEMGERWIKEDAFIIHVQVGVSSCRHGFVIYCVVIMAPTGSQFSPPTAQPPTAREKLLCSGSRLLSFQNKCGFRICPFFGKKSTIPELRLYSKAHPVSRWKLTTVGDGKNTEAHTQKQLLAGTMLETHPRSPRV